MKNLNLQAPKNTNSRDDSKPLKHLLWSFLLIFLIGFSEKTFAQFTFPVYPGPYTVTASGNVIIVNDVANSSNVPSGVYDSFTITADWSDNSPGVGAYSNEADLSVVTSEGSVLINPPTAGSMNNSLDTTLTFSGDLAGVYNPDTDGSLVVLLDQSWASSNTIWSNISVTLFEAPPFPPPVDLGVADITITSATLNWNVPIYGTPSGYEYYYTTGYVPPSDLATVNQNNVTTDLSTTISNLTQGTTYRWWVRALYGSDKSIWVSGSVFDTLPLAMVPWSEDFSGSSVFFHGWSHTNFGSVGSSPSALSPGNGSFLYKRLNSIGSANSTGTFSTLNIGQLGVNDRLRFKYKLANNSSPYNPPASNSGNFVVEVSTNGGVNYTLLEAVTNNEVAGWQDKVYNLSAYSEEIIQIRITANRISGDYYIGFDDFIIEPTPEFEYPQLPSVTDVLLTEATLNWEVPFVGTPTSYEYYYTTSSIAPGFSQPINIENTVASLSTTVTGLEGNTTYNWWVRAIYDGETSPWVAGTNFTTLPLMPVVWTEEFNSSSMPLGWQVINSFTLLYTAALEPESTSNYISKNLYGAGINATGGFSTVNIGPLTATNRLKFDYKLANYAVPYAPPAVGSGNFVVEISTDIGVSWVTLETITNNGVAGWQSKAFDLSDYEGEIIKIKITGNRISGDYWLGFDNFVVEPGAEFEPPVSLSVTDIGINTATLNWNVPAFGEPTGYEYYYSQTETPANTVPINQDNVVNTFNSTIDNINPNTQYNWWVRAIYATGNSDWVAGNSFTTNPVASIPWTEGFATPFVLPLGWTHTNFGSVNSQAQNPAMGDYIYKQLNGTSSNATGNFTTLDIGPLGVNNRLKFEYKLASTAPPYFPAVGSGNIIVEISTDSGLTWGTLETFINNGIEGWQVKTYGLEDYEGEIIKIRITANRAAGEYWLGFDNFAIEPVPAYEPPVSLAVNSVAFTTTTLNWETPVEGTPTGYEYYYAIDDTAPLDTAEVNEDFLTSNLETDISELEPNTTYNWWVRAVYGTEAVSVWVEGQDFTTKPLASVPWTEEFTNSSMPFSWINFSFSVGNTTSLNPGTGNYIYKNLSETSATGSFQTINIGQLGENDRLSFDFKLIEGGLPYNPVPVGSGNFVVEISTNGGTTYTTLDVVYNNGISGWQPKTYNLADYSGEIIRLKITANRTSEYYYIGFDNFTIEPTPALEEPYNPTVNPGITSAILNWEAPFSGTPLAYEYYYSTDSVAPSQEMEIESDNVVTDLSANLSDLSQGTTYHWWVRAIYDTDAMSAWVAGPTFSTGLLTPVTWTESFATTTLPQGWAVADFSVGNSIAPLNPASGNYIYARVYNPTVKSFSTIDVGTLGENDRFKFEYKLAYAEMPDTYPGAGTGNFVIEISTDYGNSWATLETVHNNGLSGWQVKQYNLSAYEGEIVKIRIKVNQILGDYYIGFDNFIIESVPLFDVPHSLTTSNVLVNSATLNWQTPSWGEPIGYEYYYAADTTAPSSSAPINEDFQVTTLGVDLSGLVPNTLYNWWVRAIYENENTSEWVTSTLLLQPLASVVWTEDFGSMTAFPEGWSHNGTWEVGLNSILGSENSNYAFVSVSSSNQTRALTTLNVGPLGENDRLKFHYKLARNSAPYNPPPIGASNFVVEVSTDFGANWEVLETVPNNGVAGWQLQVFNLDDYSGEIIKIRITTNWVYTGTNISYCMIGFDNFTVEPIPVFDVPVDLTAQGGVTTANLSWVAPLTGTPIGYEYFYTTGETVPSDADAVNENNVVTTLGTTLTDLTPNTVHNWWLRAIYSEIDKSSWLSGPEFVTQNIASVPWAEDLESSNLLPFGWQATNTIMIGGVTPLSPGSPRYIYSYMNNTTSRNFSTINVGTLGENDRLVFDYKLAYNFGSYDPPLVNSGNFVLEISSDFGVSWTIIETVANNGVAGWQQKIYNLSAYSGEIVQLKFTMNRTLGSYYIGFDNFVIEPIPLFDFPNDLSVDNGITTANIQWAVPLSGTPTGYEYYYSSDNIAPEDSATVNEDHVITSLNGTMVGLTPNTSYQWWLRAVYGTNGVSQWVAGSPFTTQPLTPVIWTEDFTALGSSLPVGWTQNNSWNIGQHNALNPNSGNSIYKTISTSPIGNTGNFSTINIGPLGVKDFLRFDYKLAGTNFPYNPPVEDSGNFVVEISTNHGTTWTVLETVINNGLSGWQNKSYNLAAYSGEIVKIRITANYILGGGYIIAFDNFVIEPVPVYDAPVNLSANLAGLGAVLNWETPLTATPTGYEYYYSSESTAPSESAEVNQDNVVSGLNVTLSDLYLNLTYNWWVRAVYGTEGTSVWVAGQSFMTEPLASVPWSEEFPNFALPGGWSAPIQGLYYFSVGTQPALEPGDGNYIMSMSDYMYTSSFSTINIGQLGANDILKFDYKITDTAQPYDTPIVNNGKFTVEISTNHGTTWELLGTVVNNGVSGWITQLYNLSAYSGEIIRLRITLPAEQSVYNFGFDNFVIEPGSEFDFPVPTQATDINFFSATLNWDAPMVGSPTGYEYYYSNTGATPSDADEVNEDYLVTTLNATVSGLLQGTTYNWWIRAVYPSGNSPWLSGVTFTTVPLASVTWEENFAQYELPEGWSLQGFNYNTIGTILPLQPGTGNYIYTSLMNNQPRSFSTVDVGPLGTNDRLKFSYKHALLVEPYESPGEGSGNFVVEISTDFGTTWTVLDTVLNNDIEGWQNKTYSLSDYNGEIVKIRIKMNWASSNYYLGFDNFLIEPQPVFEYPLTLHTTNIKLYSAVLNWHEPYEGTPIGYEYYYSDSSTPSDDDVVNSDNMVTDLYVSLSGLTSNTTYNWWVRALYEDGMSDWEAADSFITQPLASVTWTEDFTTFGVLPLGWNNSHENDYYYSFQVSSPYGMNMEPFDYSVFKRLTTAQSSTGSIYTTNVGPLGVHDRLKFIYRLANTTTPFAAPAQDSGNFVLEISTDEGETWTVIDTVINNGIAGWQEKVYSLQDYNTEVIKLKITANWASGSYNLAFDNFIIEPTPEFDYPIHPENGHTWLTTANLSWDAPHFGVPSGYEFYYSTDDVAPFDEADVNTDNVVTGQNISLSGLAHGTTYNWWVRAVYPTGQSIWIEAEPFTTQWLTSVIWAEDFTDINSLPVGWSHSEFGNVGSVSSLQPGSGNYIHKTVTTAGSSTASFSGPNGSFSTINIGPLGVNDRLKFDYKFQNTFSSGGAPGEGTGNIVVEISTDGGLVWEILENMPNNGIEGWQNKAYNLSDYNGEIIKVRITANRTSGHYYLGFDNFIVEPVPVLEYPTYPLMTFAGLTTATFAWEAPTSGIPGSYEYYFSTENIAPSNAAAVNLDNVVTDLSAEISGLTPDTTYNWWVRAVYDNGESTWVMGENFTTQPLAPLVWTEEFNDATTQPLGWSSSQFLWFVGTNYIIGEGTGSYIYTMLTGTNSSKDISTINIGTLSADNLLTFSYKTTSSDFPYNPPFAGTGNIVVNISTDAGQTWNALDVIPNDGLAGWHDVEYDLSDYEDEIIKVRITANHLSGGSFYVSLDNFRVGPIPATSVDVTTLDDAPATINTDDGTLQLVATVNPLGAAQFVVWSVESGSEYASVNENGLVTAIDNGTVTVRATSVEDISLYDEITITITNQILSATSVVVSTQDDVPAVITTDDGELQLVATVTPSNAINTVTWSVESGSAYASVNENGLVTAIDNGTVTVRATSVEDAMLYDEITITITNQIVPATTVVVSTQDDVDAVITTDDGVLQLVATVAPTNTVHTVTWSVESGSEYASVDEDGLVTALDNGTVTIRATSTGNPAVYGEITITITNQMVLATSVVVSTQDDGAAVITTDDGVLQLVATVTPSNAIHTVTWSVESGSAYASVDEDGLVTALDNGTVTVRATSTENPAVYGEITITITNQIVPVASVVISTQGNVPAAITTDDGELQLVATVNPSNAVQIVVWTLESGATYATLDENGLLTALNNGTVTVRATSTEDVTLYDEITITITNQIVPATSVVVSTQDNVPATITTDDGELQLVATVNPSNAIQTVVWTIESGSEYASVDENGLVTAIDNGTITIRATSTEDVTLYDEITISITNQIVPATSVVVNTQDDVDAVITTDDGELQLVATVNPSNAVPTVVWTIESGAAYAMVDENGLVTALDNGTVTIRATSTGDNAIFGEIDITITNQIIDVESVVVTTLDDVEATIPTIGDSLQLIATVNPSNATQTVVWSVESGSEYATVDENGLVTALANGLAVVRATSIENTEVYGEIEVMIDALSVNNPLLNTIKLYPNPTDGKVYLSETDGIQKIEVFNLTGQKLMTLNTAPFIDLTPLNTGTYLIKIKTDKGTSIQKIIRK